MVGVTPEDERTATFFRMVVSSAIVKFSSDCRVEGGREREMGSFSSSLYFQF